MSENNVGKGIFLGLLAGGLLGAVAGMLFAPKSGKELRDDIRSRTNGYMDDADKYIADAKDKAKDLINEGKKKSEKLINDAKIKSDELLKDAEKVFGEAKAKANSTIASGKETMDHEASKLKDAVKAGVDAYKNTKNT